MSNYEQYDYEEIDVQSATVTTVIPYTEGAEYREYTVSGEELPDLLMRIDDPRVSERVVTVDIE